MASTNLVFFSIFCSLSVALSAPDTIQENGSIRDGETIVSSEGKFEVGFFAPANSNRRYVGIWYKNISNGTVVWIANRDAPLNDTSGVLQIDGQGKLSLFSGEGQNQTVWTSNSSITAASSVVAQILDSGNLVLRPKDDTDPGSYLWQSFDYPGDTFLPGMKYGINLVTGLNRPLTSWRTPDDPSMGHYKNEMDPNGVPQFFLTRDSVIQFRSGPWNGLRFSGMPNLKPNPIYTFQFVFSSEEVYYTYNLTDSSVPTRMVLNTNGVLQRFTWIEHTQGWNLYLTAQMDNCDRYALCGPHGSCDINNSPACGCLKGFEPKYPQYWQMSDWSDGCVRKRPLSCQEGEGFLMYSGMKLPDTRQSWYNKTMNLEECQRVCLKNCNCTAFANMDISGEGSGCIHWFGDLIDLRDYTENGQDIYVRLAAAELDALSSSRGRKKARTIIIPVVTITFMLGLCVIMLILKKRKLIAGEEINIRTRRQEQIRAEENENNDLELPLFDFTTITTATKNFSLENKLGQGGFGPVYKGTLEDGQVIAVKRLSKSSRQGLDEFKNEVLCISKLQHRNLVKLLGCCIQEEERMLIYEYMPNKSLDSFIFDPTRKLILDWPRRAHIINGIARGLLYLHQDSRLRIIHRDLKASNILLDKKMNPKISDFGMARSFGGEESEGNTNRVVGTYGYMSPEYAIDGLFSVKSDVFSFGVLVLEIVSGKRNRKFSHPDHKLNLLGHAWRLLKDNKSDELIEASVRDSCNIPEVLRSIHVALLCVQQSPDDRPNMATVVLMLSSEIPLPLPKEPGFFSGRDLSDMESSSMKLDISAGNGITDTLIEGR
ncbi:hypothetical protein MLD38_012689 [Melastoma candidum]|uniref:Uncharacterized protein n=1 Tax=Melastoma candidum TaxID=119954 RepID=A0ACB9R6R0_9MYRT|nr:hypothetical protein MLD38_012689 [Melastoma candidum]